MKKLFFTGFFFFLLTLFLSAQTDIYFSFENEFLFQGASIKSHGDKMNNNMRFTIFFNTGTNVHFDIFSWGGLYTGLAIRNMGYIQDEVPDPDIDKIKRRSYTLGLPLAVKVGKMEKVIFFAGGEYEWLFHYKEKHFTGDVKSVYKDWFSNRTKHFMPSVFAGVQFGNGVNLKAKYYLSNFLNEDYVNSNGEHPFSGMDVRMFYISLSFNVTYKMVRGIADGDRTIFVTR
jgi:hypothetical protein